MIREVDDCMDKNGGEELSRIIHEKFDALKDFHWKDPPPPTEERAKQKIVWDKEISDLVKQFNRCDELKKPVTYIKNGLGNWYTFLLYPGMEPTNSLSEQAIREHVIIRKIIGTFRSETGPEYYQYIASLIATWLLQGKNIYHELKKLLTQELCLKPS